MGGRAHRRCECRLEGQVAVDDLLHQNDVPPRRRQGEPAEGRAVPAAPRSTRAVNGACEKKGVSVVLVHRCPVTICLDAACMPGYYHAPLHDDVVGLEEPLAPPPVLLCIGVVRPLTRERIKIGKTFWLGTRLLPDQGGKGLSFLAKCLFLLVRLSIAGMENHVVVMILVNGHIPLKMHFPRFWEAFHL